MDYGPRDLVDDARRSLDIAATSLPVVAGIARDQRRSTSSAQRTKRARQLRAALVDLGPAFVKLGQTMSTRPDLLPAEYVRVLETLQDDIEPAPWEDAKEVVEAELGPVEDRFDDFETEPLSGASLGQVYRATVDGDDVAVKVRRPDLEERVLRDLRIIETVVPLATHLLDEGRAFSLETLVEQYGETLREEMDYEREAELMTEIGERFAADERVRIPEVVGSHSTRRVLTMEYVDGTKITDVEALNDQGIDRPELARTLRSVYLEMTLLDGVFHADPHPGNLAVKDDGTLVFYDFGMSDRLDEDLRQHIVDLFVAVGRTNVDGVLDALVDLGTLHPGAADDGREELREVIDLFVERSRGGDVDVDRLDALLEDLEATVYEMPFRLPADLALILRVTALADGVANTLDDDHDFFSIVADFLADNDFVDEAEAQRAVEQGAQFN
ncbi:AarF/ABC1/UbiB kinase family protein [Natronomonas salina]|uniref:ABC1 kinase family protein n=1 Tax=Natronomonas salina TaxID=1710540 RepID=UPI0015B42D3C|nr:AarF/ABC1/UbiB kinase family protein [Natronomonas salina]QLD90772.1 AarF/ABC1/UbiB kinase family protein [Natronomonas salina]